MHLGLFDSDAFVDVVVAHAEDTNPSERSSFISVLRNNQEVSFEPAIHYHSGLGPEGIAVGDFDNSGRPDIAIAAAFLEDVSPRPEKGFVAIHLNDGSGAFIGDKISDIGNPSLTNKADQGRRIELDHANPGAGGDANLDAITASMRAREVVVSTGNGSGSFTVAARIDVDPNDVGRAPKDLSVADVEGDGDADFITANELSPLVLTDPGMTWIKNEWIPAGTLTFDVHELPSHPTLLTYRPQSVLLVDFTGDGLADLLEGVRVGTNSYGLLVYKFIPAECEPPPGLCTVEHFELIQEITLPNSPHQIVAGQINPWQDSYLDLAIALRGRTASGAPADGTCALGPTNQDLGGAQVVYGAILPGGQVGFDSNIPATIQDPATTRDPRGLVLAHFDSDGFPDIAFVDHCNDGLSIFKNAGDTTFPFVGHFFSVGIWPNKVRGADFDGDSNVDLAVSCYNSNNVAVLKGLGSDLFGPPAWYGAGTENYAIALGQVDGDPAGKVDIVVVNSESDDLSVLSNNGP